LSGARVGRGGKIIDEVVDGQRTAIGQFGFEVIPDLFVGIELRSISRKTFNMEPWMTSEQRGKCRATMNGAAVPQQHDVTAEMTQQQPQEGRDFEVAEVVEMTVTVETETLP